MIRTAARARLLLHTEGQEAITRFIESQRHPDGGFRGRASASDLYYTAFGLSCLIALDRPLPTTPDASCHAAVAAPDLDFVHLASGARCQILQSAPGATSALPFLKRMEGFRSDDGGYHHQVAQAATGTVYGAFLACLAYQEAGLRPPRQEQLLSTLEARRTPDGGYANASGLAIGTATATAAAVLLKRWLANDYDDAALAALQYCAAPTGGFLAFTGAPAPDLLSTATSLYALRSAGIRPASTFLHEAFIESVWHDDGGFCSHAADRQPDVEYTFYALLALGSCTRQE